MLALSQGKVRFTFPITPAEVNINAGNTVETFTVMTREERTGKPISKARRVSFSAILPRQWQEIWEKDSKQTVTYKSPEVTWKLLEQWKKKPIVLNFDNLLSQTMMIENMDQTYKDGQGNMHVSLSLVEYKPVKIVSYSNSKQLLKPGTIISKSSKSRPNTTGKTSKKNQKESKAEKNQEGRTAKKESPAKGDFDYVAQKQRIERKNRQVKGGK